MEERRLEVGPGEENHGHLAHLEEEHARVAAPTMRQVLLDPAQ